MSIDNSIRQLGIHGALTHGIIQFNSVVFRVIVGVAGYLPLESIGLVTAIEYILNVLLEVPAGFISDRIGQAKSAKIGMILIAGGLFSIFFAIVFRSNSVLSNVLIIMDGIFLGIGKPFLSGSVEAYYQAKIVKFGDSEKDKIKVETSFITSKQFGKYIPSLGLLLSFLLLFLLEKYHLGYLAIGMGGLSWIGLFIWFSLVTRELGSDVTTEGKHQLMSPRVVIRTFFTLKIFKSNLISLSYWGLGGIIMHYLIVSVGREFKGEFNELFSIASFMFGSFFCGWYISGTLLPRVIKKVKLDLFVNCLIVGHFLINLLALFYFRSSPSYLSINLFLFVFGCVFMPLLSGLGSVASNSLLKQVKSEDYAKCLSIQNMYGFTLIGLYSLYVTITSEGAPGLEDIFVFNIALALVLLIVFFVVTSLLSRRDLDAESKKSFN